MKKYVITGILAMSIFTVGVINYTNAATSQPGSSSDPIVSKSYVDTQISELKKLITGSGTTSSSGETNANIESLIDDIDDLNSDIKTLNKGIKALDSEVDDLKEDMEKLEEKISNIKNETSNNNSSSNNTSSQELTSEIIGVIDALYAEKFAKLEEIYSEYEEDNEVAFVPVQLLAGQILLGGEGAEIVPRSGTCTAYSENSMGLIDVTTGEELYMGAPLTANHLLLVARSDGRGVYAETEAWFIVKGNYTIR